MGKISAGQAIVRFASEKKPVYLIMQDGTAKLAKTITELYVHMRYDGEFSTEGEEV